MVAILSISAGFASDDVDNIQTNSSNALSADTADEKASVSDMESLTDETVLNAIGGGNEDTINKESQNDNRLGAVEDGSQDKLTDTPGTFADLKSLYDASDNYMELNRNYTRNSNYDTTQIVIDKEFTIDGKGFTISGNNIQQTGTGVFHITTSSKVIFNNIIFTKMTYHVMYFTAEANFEFNNCTFIDNVMSSTSSVSGAALYFGHRVNHGEFNNVEFKNNGLSYTGRSNGVANLFGGAIHYSSPVDDLTYNNVNFTNNRASGPYDSSNLKMYGGAIYYARSVQADYINCNFIGNIAKNRGGAIYIEGTSSNSNYTNTTFKDNQVNTNYIGGGGAIYIEGSSINDTYDGATFQGNNVTGYYTTNANYPYTYTGGAMHLSGKVTNLNFNNVNFTSNIVKSSESTMNQYYRGGAIFYGSTVENIIVNYTNCNFTNNEAKSRGGAIYISGNPLNNNYVNTTFSQNKAGSASRNNNDRDTDNIWGGGAIYVRGTSTNDKFENVSFTNNEVQATITSSSYYAAGGAIFYEKDATNLTFENVNFTENIASGSSNYPRYYGGALYFATVGNVNYINCNFTDNEAKRSGGAIYYSNSMNSNYTNTFFIGNIARGASSAQPYGGGAIYIAGASTNETYYEVTFKDNQVTGSSTSNDYHYHGGGAIYFYSTVKNLNITHSHFDKNSVTYYFGIRGGAINIAGTFTNITIENTEFKNNSAYYGGAVYVNGYWVSGDTITFSNNKFKENKGEYGGAVYIGRYTENVEFKHNNFTKNSGNDGGAIFLYNKKASFDGDNFTQNTARYRGAALYSNYNEWIEPVNFTFKNMNVKNNTATQNYGGIFYFAHYSVNSFENVNFTGNEAILGIVDYEPYSESDTIWDSYADVNFINNSARNGGAIYFVEGIGHVSFENMKFINNTASTFGGAIFSVCPTYNTFKNITFKANKAETGGAIYFWGEAHDTFENVSFMDNEAEWGGGAIMFNDAFYITINELSFINNTASEGAAIYLFSTTGNQIINSSFINNTATRGGVIFTNSSLYVKDSNFTENTGTVILLASENTTGTRIHDSKFNKNIGCIIMAISPTNTSVIDEYGDEIITEYDIDIQRSVFDENENGPVIELYNFHATVSNSHFTNNQDIAFKAENSQYNEITNVEFTNNTGAIYLFKSSAHIVESNFTDNHALSGGAIFINYNSEVVIEDSRFINNTAFDYGGSIYVSDSLFSVDGSQFINNTAGIGGAIYMIGNVDEWDNQITNGVFENNTATISGGAVYLGSDALVNLNGGNFKNNSASYTGGAMFVSAKADARLSNFEFTYNTALKGSAIDNRGILSVSDSQFFKNKAISILNVFYNRGAGKIEITYELGDNYIHAINSKNDVAFTNVDYFEYDNNNYNTNTNPPAYSQFTTHKDITVTFNDKNGDALGSVVVNTDENGKYVLDPIAGFETVTASTEEDDYYYAAQGSCNSSRKGDFDILQEMIINDTTGVIELTRDYTYTIGWDSILEGIIINKPLTINGNGHTIDALFLSRIFNVVSDNVVFNNIVFVNATGINGAFINIDNVSNIKIENCTFTNPNATIIPSHGDISIMSSDDIFGHLTPTDKFHLSVLEGNQYDFDGGAIYAVSNGMEIINSNFSNTAATIGGALYYNGSNLKIKNTRWHNIIGVYGGAIYTLGSDILIDNSNFTVTFAAGSGGAILAYGENYNITNSVFNLTIAFGETRLEPTGIIVGPQPGIDIPVLPSDPIGGRLGTNDDILGDGLIIGGKDDPVIIIDDPIVLTEKYLSEFGGGAISIHADNVRIINDSFENTFSISIGGAIYAEGNDYVIYNSSFYLCSADEVDVEEFLDQITRPSFDLPYGGGAIHSQVYNITIDESTFELCGAGSIGGAIFAGGEYTNISNSNFTDCTAVVGGAVYIDRTATDSIVDNCIFDYNYVAGSGGAIAWNADYGTLTGSTFTNNGFLFDLDYVEYMPLIGAGILWQADYALISNCNFTNNRASFTPEEMSVYPLDLIENVLSGGAGAIFGGNITISECVFKDNYAVNGGALLISGYVIDQDGDNLAWEGMSAGRDITTGREGGGVPVDFPSESDLAEPQYGVTVEKSKFINNTAYNGGAVVTSGEGILFDDCEFESNTALKAGAIYVQSDSTVIFNSTFKNNVALLGGAIIEGIINVQMEEFYDFWGYPMGEEYNMYEYGSHNTISNSTFINNMAESAGAVLWITEYGEITDDSHFISNFNANVFDRLSEAFLTSFGVSFNESEYEDDLARIFKIEMLDWDNELFDVPLARNVGGALYWFGNGGNVENTEFMQNQANKGGAIYWIGDFGSIQDSSFDNNTAYSVVHEDTVENTTYFTYYYNYTDVNLKQYLYGYMNSPEDEYAEYMLITRPLYYGNGDELPLIDQLSEYYGVEVKYIYGEIVDYTDKGSYTFDVVVRYVFKMSKNQTISYSDLGRGGAVYSNTWISIAYSNFTDNVADYGGAVYGLYDVIGGSSFIHNGAIKGGAVYALNETGSIIQSQFENNYGIEKEITGATVTVQKEVIDIENPDMYVNGVRYTNIEKLNEAYKYFNIYKYLTDQSIIGYIVIDDSASQLVPDDYQEQQDETGEGGGGYYVPVDIYGEYEMDAETGDSYFIATLHYEIYLINYEFDISDGQSYGGAVYVEGDGISDSEYPINTIEESVFINNTAYYGGAVYVNGEYNNVLASDFLNNTAYYGGAIYNRGSYTSLMQSNFYNNTAHYGGAVYAEGLTGIDGCEFIFNKADKGSAVYTNSSTIYVYSSAFLQNKALATSLTTSVEVDGHDVYVTAIFTGNDNLINALYVENEYFLDNVWYWSSNGIISSDEGNPELTSFEDGINITVELLNLDSLMDIQVINITNIQGQAIFYIPNVRSGRYYVVASHEEDDYYTRIGTFEPVQVGMKQSPINIDAKDIFYRENETVNITLDRQAEGNITIYLDGEVISVKNLTDGFASINITGLKVGTYNITVQYNGSSEYDPSNESVTFNVKQIRSTVTIQTDGGNYSTNIPVNITVGPYDDVSGKVIITVEDEYGETITINDTNELKTFVHHLNAGEYTLIAYYLGDDNYYPSFDEKTLIVRSIDLNPAVSAANVTVAENTTFTIVLPNDFVGKVNITVDEFSIVYDIAGSTQITFVNLPAGNKTANVTFYGDGNYNNATVYPVNFTVTEAILETPSAYTITVNIPDTNYPNKTTAQVNVSGNLYGNATIFIDDKQFPVTIENGTGSVDITGLSAGVKTATVNFTSTDNKTNLTATTKFAIDKAQSAVNITVDGTVVRVNITDGATGTVDVYINGVKEVFNYNGTPITCENTLMIGNNTIVAVYEGNENYTESQKDKNVEIAKNKATVNVTADPITYGGDAEIIVLVGEGQTGHVTITVNNENYTAEIKNNSATFHIPGLNATDYPVSVRYSGDNNYENETNDTVLTVNRANLTATVTGQNVTVAQNTSFIIANVPDSFKGNVNITVDDAVYSGDVKSLINMAKLTAGDKTAAVVFYGDSNYNDLPLTVNFTVSRLPERDVIVTVNVADVDYPNPATAVINVTGKANGTVIVTVNGVDYEAQDVVNGEATVELGILSAGVKNITARFIVGENDLMNTNATGANKFVVNKADSKVELATEGKDVTINVIGEPGKVIVYINGVRQEINFTDIAITLSDALSVGNNTVLAIYEGNENYTGSQNNTDAEINKTKATVNVTADPITYGGDAEIIVRVGEGQTGHVTITVNNEEYTAEIKDGGAIFHIPGLNATDYPVSVRYSGDANYENETNDTVLTVNRADLPATVEGHNATVNDNTLFILNNVPDDFNGYVNITVDNLNYTGKPKSLIEMDKLTVGEKTATIVFYGDSNYNDLPLTVNFTVTRPAESTTTITVTVPDTTYPGPATAIINVTGKANGTVIVSVDGKEYEAQSVINGEATVELGVLSAGVKNITARFIVGEDDLINTNATAASKFMVNKAISKVELATEGNDVIVNVIGEPGKVIVYINGVRQELNYTDSAITLSDALAIGNNTVLAIYEGNENYTGSQNNTDAEINKTKSTVNVTADPITYGSDAIITVTVGEGQTGIVTITVNNEQYSSEITSREIIFHVPGLNATTYPVTVKYSGDSNYDSETNDTLLTVNRADLPATVEGHNATVNDNTLFILNNVPDDFKGKVNITVDGITYNGDPKSLIEMAKLTSGEKAANVLFYGDENYNDLPLTVNFTVTRVTTAPTTITVTVKDVTYSEAATAVVNVTGYANGTVIVTVNGVDYEAQDVVNGKATVELGILSAGVKNITARFTVGETDLINTNATGASKFMVEKADSKVELITNDKNITVNVIGGAGKLTVYVNGVKQEFNFTGEAITLSDALGIGNNTVLAIYEGNENYTGSQNSTDAEIKKNKATVNVTADPITYGSDAIIIVTVGEGQKGYVTITVNDKEYTSEINANQITFNVPGLNATTYPVTVKYSGDDSFEGEINDTTLTVKKADLTATVEGFNATVNDNTLFILNNVPDDFHGHVNITVDGITYSGDPKSLIEMAKLTSGEKTANVLFYGDENYNDLPLTVNFTVSRVTAAPTTMTVTVRDVTYPGTATAIVNVTGYANGTVIVTVNGVDYEARDVVNGQATVELGILSAGVKNVTAKFTVGETDLINTNATGASKFMVEKASSKVELTTNDKNITVNVIGGAGKLTVYVNGVKQEFNFTGEAITLSDALGIGNNTVLAIYEGNENYTGSQNSTDAEIKKNKATVNVAADAITYGADAVIVVNVGEGQKGYVTITVNDKEYSSEINANQVTFNVPGLNATTYPVTVKYSGDDSFEGEINDTTLTVNKADLTATVEGFNATVNDNTLFILNNVPDDFHGHVNITVDGITYSGDPKSLIEMAKLTAGDKTANVLFYGDENYNDLPLTVNFTVSRVTAAPTTMTVTVKDVTYPGTATAIVNVTGYANGTVIVTVNGVDYDAQDVVNGQATVELGMLSAGVKNITAKFTVGETDLINTNATASNKFVVEKAQSNIKVSVEDGKIIINVTEGSSANVAVYVNGIRTDNAYTGDIITIDDALSVGNNTVLAIYEGNENYTDSQDNATHFIAKKESFVSAGETEIVYGADAVLTVNVPVAQTGYVTIIVNNQNLTQEIKDAKSTFTIHGLTVKEYSVSITYSGDNAFDSQVNTTLIKVIKADLNATVIGENITVIQNSEFIIHVPDDFTGKVNITVDGYTYSGDAKSLVTMDKLTAGDKTATAVFYGDVNYNDLILTANFTVSELPIHVNMSTVNADNMTRGYNSQFDYQASFLDSEGNALVNTEVEFRVNGQTYKVKTNKDGIAQLTTSKLDVGVYNVTSVNLATGEEATAQLTIVARIIENKDLTMDFSSGKYFTVKVIGDDGNIAPKGEIIDIYINGIHYVAKVNAKGYAKLKINLNPKKYKVVAEYKTYKTTNKLVVKQVLKLVKKTVSAKKGKKVVLKAKLKWSSGKPIKGKKIVFKFKGKKYNAKTNSKGIAKVTIKAKVTKKLKKGKKYAYSASYKTNKVKGKIKVKK